MEKDHFMKMSSTLKSLKMSSALKKRLFRFAFESEESLKDYIIGRPRAIMTFVLHATLDGYTPFYFYWLWIVSIAFIYNILLIPVRASFTDLNAEFLPVWLIIDYACDAIYLLDMLVHSRYRYYQQGIEIYDVKLLNKKYLKSRQFIVDVISILPTDLIYIGFGFDYTIVRLNRFLRISRLFEMVERVESTSAFPNVFRFANTVFFTLICILYTTVFFHSYSKAIGFADSEEDFQLSKAAASMPFFPRFMKCLFWGMMMVTLLGEQNPPQTPVQGVISVAIWILGLALFGVIVGRIGEILDNTGASEDAYKRQLDSVRGYLTRQNLPKTISRNIINWFGYAYENNALGSAEKALKPLPTKLRSEIAMDMHLASLRKVQLFADLEKALLVELVGRFKLQVFGPGDYVCKKGDIGREMYVVKVGSLEVVSDDGAKVFVTLKEGTVFGEISLLHIPGSRTGNRRTANVRSKGFSNLFSLAKDDLYDVLEDYPGAMQKLVDKGTDILRKEKKLDEEMVARSEASERVLDEKIKLLTKSLNETEELIALLMTTIRHSQTQAASRLDLLEQKMPWLNQDEDQVEPENQRKKKTVRFAEADEEMCEDDISSKSSFSDIINVSDSEQGDQAALESTEHPQINVIEATPTSPPSSHESIVPADSSLLSTQKPKKHLFSSSKK